LQRRSLYFLTLLELIWFGASLLSAKFGVLYLDEAWYLTASHLVSEGQLLYRDFAFTQGPVLPYVYGTLLAILGTNLAIGRFISVALSALALALVLNITHRLAAMRAAVFAFLLIFATPHILYFLVLVKTYSLSAALTLLALALVLHSGSSRSARWPLLSTLVAGLAALTRLSFLPVLGLVCLLWVWRGRGRASGLGLLVLGVCTLALAASSNGNLLFDVLGYHLGNTRGEVADLGSMAPLVLATAIVFLPALVWALFLLMLWSLVPAFRSRLAEWWRTEGDAKALLLLVAAALVIVHFVAHPEVWEYQIPGYLLVVVVLAALSTPVGRLRDQPAWTMLLIVCMVASSVGLWRHVLPGLWQPTSTLLNASNASGMLAQRGKPGDTLLGGFNYLALASGLQVYPGNEMGMFSVADASSPPETTARHILSKEAVTEALANCSATFVATDPDAIFRVTIPSIQGISEATRKRWMDLVEENYRLIYSDRDVRIFQRKGEECEMGRSP
jgi:hypothetical protein